MRLLHAIWSATVLPSLCLAQTGPGGVGSPTSNILWLDANYQVTVASNAVVQWHDRSGNAHHAGQTVAEQRPLLAGSTMNGYPSILFDNHQTEYDFLQIPDNSRLEGMTGLTGFVIYQLLPGTAASAPRCFFSKRDGVDIQEAYDWFLWGGSSGTTIHQQLDIVNTNNRIASSTSYTPGNIYLNSFTYHGGAPINSSDQILYDGNTAVGNGTENATSIPNYTSDLYIGILRGHTGSGSNASRFNGYMSEIILYNTVLNDAQRMIVNNYLAAKYGIALSAGDIYRQDESAQGNYDHEAAGIGRTNSENIHADAQGGILRMNNPSALDDNEFLMWGHDQGSLGTFGVHDLPSGVEGRWQRIWRVSELSTSGTAVDVGTVDIIFDLSSFPNVTANDLRLLVDTDNDYAFANSTVISGAQSLGSGQFLFSSVSALVNNARLTLGTANLSSTPLPVRLLTFEGEPWAGGARLHWSTATEHNSDHFSIERSGDMLNWRVVGQVGAAGESTTLTTYEALDDEALVNTTYYRLKQVDIDGTFTLSQTISLLSPRIAEPLIWPNPATTHLHIALSEEEADQSFSILDTQGRTVHPRSDIVNSITTVDLSDHIPGMYIVSISSKNGTLQRRIVVTH